MLKVRVIPCLLMLNRDLVKTVRFKEPKYVGDPINTVRIFNDKEADEMAFVDIGATPAGTGPRFDLLADIASDAFMPFGYVGRITTVEQVKRLYGRGCREGHFQLRRRREIQSWSSRPHRSLSAAIPARKGLRSRAERICIGNGKLL